MRYHGRAVRRIRGSMNRTESAYAQELELRKKAGDILWYQFECVKFRLADKTFWEPDFLVVNKNLEFEIHEVKGFMEDDAAVKIKTAAEIFPMRVLLVRFDKATRRFTKQEV